jgi:hypothetical protein
MRVDTSQFNRAIAELQNATGAEDSKIIFNTARGLMIGLARFTFLMKKGGKKGLKKLLTARAKYSKGRARLGWWPAWKYLGTMGAPRVGDGPLKDRGEGGVVDRSKRIFDPFITVFNEVPYIMESERKRRTVAKALANQVRFLDKAIERAYTKMLKGKSG